MQLTFIIIVAYLLGAIPSALVIGKLFFGIDIREKGSGNMGSTNTFRTIGWKAGIAVQTLDILKGVAAVVVARIVFSGNLPFPNMTPFEDITIVSVIAGIAAVIGHVWTVFGKFRGGKGINTALGMLIAITPIEVAIAIGIFVLVLLASGYVSLGSMIAAASLPTTMFVRHTIFGVEIQGYHTLLFFIIGLAGFLIFTHRSNIQRLLRGSENRFNKFWLFRKSS
ncbi:MAG: glycerol-3-phosphate 1-O-acyltransferase PlsY [Ignavibacteriae bacterium]|nr:glycerol-3-phosphate 1-O-acyltransferase PlsY [Ignavibacteriota bacterium]MCB9217775.1 glycerol-3-phosphate 1-O-acyltransferase PlsY [Ignavibacteria bacterium]